MVILCTHKSNLYYARNFHSWTRNARIAICKLAQLAAVAKARGTKVYHLKIGQHDLPTPQYGLRCAIAKKS